jgi:hypothetical protein
LPRIGPPQKIVQGAKERGVHVRRL